MNFRDRLKFLFSGKASQGRIVSTQLQIGQAINTPKNYTGFAKEGYAKNLLVYKCVSMIASACGGIEWELYSKRKGASDKVEIEDSPLLTLMGRPNPMQGTKAFIESVVAYYLLTGNSYIEQVKFGATKTPLELWALRPDRMKIIGGKDGYPGAYEYSASGRDKRFPVDPIKLTSDIIHLKTFNPLDDWYGMSPLEAACMSMDQNNAAGKWNLALLQNSATPSGVLQAQSTSMNPRGELTEEQFRRLKDEFAESYQGARNAGRPMLLEGGLEWKAMSLSPREMDFLNAKESTASDIAMVFGVPPEMLGLGQKTFNNYKEARLSFYEETVLPLMDGLRDELNRSVAPAFGEGLYLDYDKDDVEALQYKREQKFTMIKDATFLTQNEKREAVGYDAADGWDVFLIGNQTGATPEEFEGGNEDATSGESNQPDEAPGSMEAEDEEPGEMPEGCGDGTCNEPGCPDCEGNPPPKPKKENEESDALEFKGINLVTRNEKLGSWKAQNTHRNRLIKSLSRDLEHDLMVMAREIGQAAKSSTDNRLAEFAMLKAVDENMEDIKHTLEKHTRYALEDFGQAILSQGKKLFAMGSMETKVKTRKFDSYVSQFVKHRTATAITQIEGTTRKEVMRAVRKYTDLAIRDAGDDHYSLSDFADDIQSDFENLSRGRANTIARTEVGMASSAGSLEAAKALEVPNLEKEWVSAEDDRVRHGEHGGADHAAVDGQRVPLDEKFRVPPDASMDMPLDPSAGADQVCNCRCVLVYKAGKE